MTTLAERREWMRAGCPVVELLAPESTCKTFRLTVQMDTRNVPESLTIVIRCSDCEVELGVSRGLWTSYKDVNGEYARKAADEFTRWMVTHAMGGGMKHGEAEEAYALDRDRVAQWVRWLVMKGHDGRWGGARGQGHQASQWSPRVWLDKEPVLSPWQPREAQ